MQELINALKKNDRNLALKIYTNEIVSKMFFFKEHIIFIKQHATQGEGNYIAQMEQTSAKWEPIKTNLFEQIQGNNLTMAQEAANNLNESMTEFNTQLYLFNVEIKTIAETNSANAQNSLKIGIVISLGISIVLIVIVLLISFFFPENFPGLCLFSGRFFPKVRQVT